MGPHCARCLKRRARKSRTADITFIRLLTRTSDDHPNSTYANAMTGTLFMLGFFVVFLSSFLITNTLSALLNQQVQQIGTMKTIGATSRHIVQIYITLIVLYGVLAFIVAVPLSAQASFALARFFSAAINTEVLSCASLHWR